VGVVYTLKSADVAGEVHENKDNQQVDDWPIEYPTAASEF